MKLVISAWETYTKDPGEIVQAALDAGEIEPGDTVWSGDDGSIIVDVWIDGPETEHTEYTDFGTVAEWLAE